MEAVDPTVVCEMLRGAGFRCQPSELQIEAREDRWLVRFPGECLAWFTDSASGLERLRNERRVLRLLEARCTFLAPRVLFENSGGTFEVRTVVPGGCDVLSVHEMIRGDGERARQLGVALGAMLGEQHSQITAADVECWLPRSPAWPESREWIRERLPRVVDDVELIMRADLVMEAFEAVSVEEADRVLVHADLGLHNLGIDAKTFALRGIYDYEGAAWADRHHDFQYLVFGHDHYELLNAATSVYEETTGHRIRRDRVFLYNAACAITFLAFRHGVEPATRWCGRTLAEDVNWSRKAIDKALAAN
jgi:aminoglycoside phosphotransferase (APT) family kinase protein